MVTLVTSTLSQRMAWVSDHYVNCRQFFEFFVLCLDTGWVDRIVTKCVLLIRCRKKTDTLAALLMWKHKHVYPLCEAFWGFVKIPVIAIGSSNRCWLSAFNFVQLSSQLCWTFSCRDSTYGWFRNWYIHCSRWWWTRCDESGLTSPSEKEDGVSVQLSRGAERWLSTCCVSFWRLL